MSALKKFEIAALVLNAQVNAMRAVNEVCAMNERPGYYDMDDFNRMIQRGDAIGEAIDKVKT